MTLLRLLISILAIGLLAGGSQAQPTDETAAELPSPARLAIVEGSAYFWRPGDAQWSAAQVNTALVAGDALATGERTNVEVQIGSRDFVRMMADSQLILVRHDAGYWQFRVPAGNVSFDLRSLGYGQQVEIDAPNAQFIADRGGYYRIEVRGDTSALIVRNGGHAMLAMQAGRGRDINAGEVVVARGQVNPVVEPSRAPPPDGWDHWNDARSDYYAKAASYRYLPPDVYGAAELDQYGSWRETADYGTIWVPAVAGGWAPFSQGSWRWDPVYEWTWIDQAPWGWATGHYGRWVLIDGYWAWAPGPRASRVAYLPATVAFYGDDGNVAIGVSPLTAGVTWVALGWGEPVLPWWGHREFRGHPWWGGWHGPRVVNNIVIEHHNRIDPGTIYFRNRSAYLPHAGERHETFDRPGDARRFDRPGDDHRNDRAGDHRTFDEHNRPAMQAVPQVTAPIHSAVPTSPTANFRYENEHNGNAALPLQASPSSAQPPVATPVFRPRERMRDERAAERVVVPTQPVHAAPVVTPQFEAHPAPPVQIQHNEPPVQFQRNEVVRPAVHVENNPHPGKDEHKKDDDNHGHNNRQ